MGPSSKSLGYMRPYSEHVENHDRHAHRDGRVRDVERPEMVRAPIDVDEVDDRPGDDAIEQIPGGAPDDECEADPGDELMVRETRGVHADADVRRRRNH